MITHKSLRLSLLGLATGALVLLPTAAFADTPDAWKDAPEVSGLEFLLVLFLIPAGLALVIGVLAAIPAIVGGDKGYQPGRAFQGSQWFGGPADGSPEAGDASDAEAGGASARW